MGTEKVDEPGDQESAIANKSGDSESTAESTDKDLEKMTSDTTDCDSSKQVSDGNDSGAFTEESSKSTAGEVEQSRNISAEASTSSGLDADQNADPATISGDLDGEMPSEASSRFEYDETEEEQSANQVIECPVCDSMMTPSFMPIKRILLGGKLKKFAYLYTYKCSIKACSKPFGSLYRVLPNHGYMECHNDGRLKETPEDIGNTSDVIHDEILLLDDDLSGEKDADLIDSSIAVTSTESVAESSQSTGDSVTMDEADEGDEANMDETDGKQMDESTCSETKMDDVEGDGANIDETSGDGGNMEADGDVEAMDETDGNVQMMDEKDRNAQKTEETGEGDKTLDVKKNDIKTEEPDEQENSGSAVANTSRVARGRAARLKNNARKSTGGIGNKTPAKAEKPKPVVIDIDDEDEDEVSMWELVANASSEDVASIPESPPENGEVDSMADEHENEDELSTSIAATRKRRRGRPPAVNKATPVTAKKTTTKAAPSKASASTSKTAASTPKSATSAQKASGKANSSAKTAAAIGKGKATAAPGKATTSKTSKFAPPPVKRAKLAAPVLMPKKPQPPPPPPPPKIVYVEKAPPKPVTFDRITQTGGGDHVTSYLLETMVNSSADLLGSASSSPPESLELRGNLGKRLMMAQKLMQKQSEEIERLKQQRDHSQSLLRRVTTVMHTFRDQHVREISRVKDDISFLRDETKFYHGELITDAKKSMEMITEKRVEYARILDEHDKETNKWLTLYDLKKKELESEQTRFDNLERSMTIYQRDASLAEQERDDAVGKLSDSLYMKMNTKCAHCKISENVKKHLTGKVAEMTVMVGNAQTERNESLRRRDELERINAILVKDVEKLRFENRSYKADSEKNYAELMRLRSEKSSGGQHNGNNFEPMTPMSNGGSGTPSSESQFRKTPRTDADFIRPLEEEVDEEMDEVKISPSAMSPGALSHLPPPPAPPKVHAFSGWIKKKKPANSSASNSPLTDGINGGPAAGRSSLHPPVFPPQATQHRYHQGPPHPPKLGMPSHQQRPGNKPPPPAPPKVPPKKILPMPSTYSMKVNKNVAKVNQQQQPLPAARKPEKEAKSIPLDPLSKQPSTRIPKKTQDHDAKMAAKFLADPSGRSSPSCDGGIPGLSDPKHPVTNHTPTRKPGTPATGPSPIPVVGVTTKPNAVIPTTSSAQAPQKSIPVLGAAVAAAKVRPATPPVAPAKPTPVSIAKTIKESPSSASSASSRPSPPMLGVPLRKDCLDEWREEKRRMREARGDTPHPFNGPMPLMDCRPYNGPMELRSPPIPIGGPGPGMRPPPMGPPGPRRPMDPWARSAPPRTITPPPRPLMPGDDLPWHNRGPPQHDPRDAQQPFNAWRQREEWENGSGPPKDNTSWLNNDSWTSAPWHSRPDNGPPPMGGGGGPGGPGPGGPGPSGTRRSFWS